LTDEGNSEMVEPAKLTQSRDTAVICALETAALNPEIREFKTGILQT
jgi:hypothetical protein